MPDISEKNQGDPQQGKALILRIMDKSKEKNQRQKKKNGRHHIVSSACAVDGDDRMGGAQQHCGIRCKTVTHFIKANSNTTEEYKQQHHIQYVCMI
ncbi:hypothetical protein DSCW_06830 [Desulfosarcina widdelii]|uniref:Uncharacterized protein n=1 Tax=Desulfosarcina widdelii TaxID=947919 RepID=A0A5K7YVD0_9BACT|nr:hypothetical protein DSCW_06830 [Desulfosarcina widdelii]